MRRRLDLARNDAPEREGRPEMDDAGDEVHPRPTGTCAGSRRVGGHIRIVVVGEMVKGNWLLRALRDLEAACANLPSDGLPNTDEEPIWKHIVKRAVAAGDDPHIRSRPDEAIQLGNDDPASILVQSQLGFHVCRDFDGISRIFWCGVRDRRNEQLSTILSNDGAEDNHHRPILTPAFLAARRFV